MTRVLASKPGTNEFIKFLVEEDMALSWKRDHSLTANSRFFATNLPLRRVKCIFLILAVSLLFGSEAFADSLPVIQVPRAAIAPAIDGHADGPTWVHAAIIHGLSPALGVKGAQDRIAGLPTDIRLLWDADFLYMAFECRGGHIDADPNAKPGDLLYMHSACEVFIDPVGDGRQYMEFQFSPFGQSVSVNHLVTAAPEYTSQGRLIQSFSDRNHWYFIEPKLDGLRVATSRDSANSSWSLTVAIPAGPILRRRGLDHYVPGGLRANFARHEFQPNPASGKPTLFPMYWSPVLFGCPHISADLMGHLQLDP